MSKKKKAAEQEVVDVMNSLMSSFTPEMLKRKKFELVTKNPMEMSPVEVAAYTVEFKDFTKSVYEYLKFLGSLVNVVRLHDKLEEERGEG